MSDKNKEIADRIKALRTDLGLSMQEMAEATGRDVAEYSAQENGEKDLTVTFLHKCAGKLGVDVIQLITGSTPRLSGYQVTRADEGLSVKRGEEFEYLHKASNMKGRSVDPFLVTAPFVEEEQDEPIHLSYHEGQELDYVISGQLRFSFEGREEVLNPGDTVLYDSGRGHGMIAINGKPCVFLAVVIPPK